MGMDYDTWLETNPTDLIEPVKHCEQCGADLYEGDSAIQDQDGDVFCDTECAVSHLLSEGLIQSTMITGEDE